MAAEALDVPLSELINHGGTDLEARISDVRFSLAGAQNARDGVLAEVEQRRAKVDELREEPDELETDEQRECQAEVERDLAEDLEVDRWPR